MSTIEGELYLPPVYHGKCDIKVDKIGTKGQSDAYQNCLISYFVPFWIYNLLQNFQFL